MRLTRVSVLAMFLVSTVGVTDALRAQPGRGNGRGNDRDNDRGREQGRTLFTWSGVVDREVTLVMRGRNLEVQGERGVRSRDARPRTTGALPRTNGDVRVRLLDGRGQVVVLQQPSSRNNYTTIIRVRDPQAGDDRYRITTSWQPDARTARGRNDDRNRDRDRRDDRDDDWGWGRDDDSRNRNETGSRGGIWGVLNGGVGGNNDRSRDSRYNEGVRFSGIIDDVVDLRIRGRRVEVVERSGGRTRDARSTFRGELPRQAVNVQVARADGRGDVRVIQQPSARNDYTAVVRVEDRSGGAARYDVDVRW